MPSAYQIVVNTPLWVWPLMLFVLWLGWCGLQPRIHAAGAACHPAPGRPRDIAGRHRTIAATRPCPRRLGRGADRALPLGYAIGTRRAVRLRPEDGRLEVAGGWFALGFGISIFVVRYTLGVLSGVMPGLRVEPLWIVLSGGVGGIVTGIGVGWLANLLLRAYRPAVVRS